MEIIRIAAQPRNKKTRIAVYCRVSTKMEEQEDSLEMQREAYTSLIRLRSDWQLVGVYSDSISGLSAEKRTEFMRMIADAMSGKIDRILCKSVSRFSRNVAECKKYTDMLRLKNVVVEFEKEHLRTDDPTSTFVFSLMSAIAENESRSISDNVKWGYRERFKRGEYNLGNNRILGYDTVKGVLVPNKDAEVVRMIFHRYAEGKTFRSILDELSEKGVTRMRSKAAWTVSNLLGILRNETYVGDKLLQKNAPYDFLTKRSDPTADYDSFYIDNDHEAIIDRETWNKVQERLDGIEHEKRLGVRRRGNDQHVFYGKIFCGECGATYKRRTFSVKEADGVRHYYAWNCRERQKGKSGNGCKAPTVQEKVLEEAICEALGWSKFDPQRFESEVARVEIAEDGIKVERATDTGITENVETAEIIDEPA